MRLQNNIVKFGRILNLSSGVNFSKLFLWVSTLHGSQFIVMTVFHLLFLIVQKMAIHFSSYFAPIILAVRIWLLLIN